MEEEECFICGDEVCDEELLESMDINDSIKDLSKSLSNLLSVSTVTLTEYPPLCYKCINRVLDAHNLFNQINLLQVKLKVIQYDVHSLMKKTEEGTKRKGPGRPKLSKALSKFQRLRKEVVKGLTKTTTIGKGKSKTKTKSAMMSSSFTIPALSIDPLRESEIRHDQDIRTATSDVDLDLDHDDCLLNSNESTDDVDFTRESPAKSADVLDCEVESGKRGNLKETGRTKNNTTRSHRKLLSQKMNDALPSKRTSSRISVRTEKYAEFSSQLNKSKPLVDSSDDEDVLDVPDDADDEEAQNEEKSENPRNYDPTEDPLSGKLTCPHSRCNTVYFKDDFSLRAHIKRIHEGNKKPFECETCGKAFQYPTYLREHRLSHTGEDNFPCSHCNIVLRSAKSRRVHEKTHTKHGKPFACGQCDKSFANKQHLQSHQISHQTDTTFTCEQCGKTFLRQRSLDLHLRVHEQPERAHCTACDKMFSTDSALKIHQEMHVRRSKPRICSKCPFQCYTRKDLKQHVKVTHRTKLLYPCEVCGRQLTTKKTLAYHLKTHSLDKPFKCSICAKAFGDQNCRRRHENLHFKQTFMCEVCGKSFAAPSYLSQHLKIHEKAKSLKTEMADEDPDPEAEIAVDDPDPEPACSVEDDDYVKPIDLDIDIVGEGEQTDEETEGLIVGDTEEDGQANENETITFAEVRGPHGEIQYVEVVGMNE